jgi:hypothetical protein
MMQDKYGNRRGETAVGKGQCCRIALHDAGAFPILLRKLGRKQIIVLKADDVTRASPQSGGSGASPRADFQNVIAQIGAA